MNIDLDGKLAVLSGAAGALASAVGKAAAANGARLCRIEATAGPSECDALISAHGEPFLLVLISNGAEGVPGTDCGGEPAGFIRIVRHLAPGLKRVVVIFSAAGLVPIRGFAEFSADQAGLASLTRTLAMELGPSCVVNAVSVGAYQTDDADIRTPRLLSHTALKRPATLSEVVSAVLFLADPDNTYMTGHTLNVDGGWAAGYARNF